MNKLRIGIMGFGKVGRQIYRFAAASDDCEVVAVCDIGPPEMLHYLLARGSKDPSEFELEGNYLRTRRFRTRLMPTNHPSEIPWDAFGVDMVIDATSRFRSSQTLEPHLQNGAKRVVLSTLPDNSVDRVLVWGVNEATAVTTDRIVSASSSTTAAMAIVLKLLSDRYTLDHVSMTTVHAYTSDQRLQDYAGPDYRRSRSGAQNIVPNDSLTPKWVEQILPAFSGKLSGYALNVPVQFGSMLDLSLLFEDRSVTAEDVNALMVKAAAGMPDLVGAAEDPIVSSDVIGCDTSALFDLGATMKAGSRTIKALVWYESLGHARRILDVVRHYSKLDGEAA